MTGAPGRVRPMPRLLVLAAAATLLIGGLASASPRSAAPPSEAAVAGTDVRRLDFTQDWRFVLVNSADITDPGGRYENADDPAYDDSAWRRLDVPHDWSIELLPTTGPGTGTSGGTGYLQGGLGWYRKSFTLPSSMAGKRISIEFDGVYMDSYVYMNGELIGNHPYGYTGFAFDLTDLAHTDGVTPNVIAVKVQNRLPSSRWYSGSGIYRNVYLAVSDPIHVARWGTFVTTPDLETTIRSRFASVHVETDVMNETGETAKVRIESTILDADGDSVGSASSKAQIGADTHRDAVDIRIRKPRLWSFDDPYRYQLRTRLVVNGKVADTYITRFGIRYIDIDPEEGLSLNGEYAKIQGVDMHHDLGALGSAINRDALLRQMTIMKSMGVNALRTSHNPPAPELVEICEELGIVMMVEAFDTWARSKTAFDYGRFFNAWGESDIKEMVNAAKNSPAVIMWSIGNEIRGQTVEQATMLVNAIKSVDTTRPVVWGSDSYRFPPSPTSTNGQIALMLDGVGLNYNTAQSVDALRALYPNQFWFESESSSSTSTRGYYQDSHLINTGENYTPGKRFASSYDNNMASWTMPGEYGLKKDRDRKFFSGEFLWSGFDYIGEPTPFNVFPVHAAHFGAVDTAGFPKDLYYAFKSQWTSDPMVHVVPMNWTDFEVGDMVEVWAYANVETVELFLNGRSLGVRTYDPKVTDYGKPYLETTEPTNDDKTFASGSYTSPNGSTGRLHLTWQVPFEPGRLVAVARKNGVRVARDELRTAGDPYTLRLTPDKHVIAANGNSLSFVTVEVVDADGVVVPGANNLIEFSVSGGVLAGLDNGRQESAEGYKGPARSAFHGMALAIIQSTEDDGPITIRATSAGLIPGTTTVWSIDDHAKRHGAGGVGRVDPVYVRTPVGRTPVLPDVVRVVRADGSTRFAAVKWESLAKSAKKIGTTTVKGTVAGLGSLARAVITAYEPSDVDAWSTKVPVGQSPTLPPTARVIYSDGVDQWLPVTWHAVPESSYAFSGKVVVDGIVKGTRLHATAEVFVTDNFSPGQNIAATSSATSASADASYSGRNDSRPEFVLDGTTSMGGWSNFFNKEATALLPSVSSAHAVDWVSIGWPTQQTFGEIRPHFTTDGSRALPASVSVSYWDGDSWVPVTGLTITWATASNAPSSLTFNPVSTSGIRLDMTSAAPGTTSGFLQMTEFQVVGDLLN
jgi:beta-galactosidase